MCLAVKIIRKGGDGGSGCENFIYIPAPVIHNRFSDLHRADKMNAVFPETLITAFHGDSNLQDILIHSKHRKIFKNERCEK